LGPIPNPQSPNPKPQSPNIKIFFEIKFLFNLNLLKKMFYFEK